MNQDNVGVHGGDPLLTCVWMHV